jgi:hypothetical protein
MVIQEHFNDLVVGTYGRGFWILDDLTPIQQMTQAVKDTDAHLFPPRPTYRFRPGTVPVNMSDDPTAGQNPPYGVAINYYLKTVPSGDVKIRIEDAKGQTVRTLTGTKTAGINRITWDLRGEQTKEVRMRTAPAYAPEISLNAEGWRAAPGAARMSVLLPPGNYTVKMSASGKELSQPFVVKKDPNSSGSEADIVAQVEMLFELRRNLETAADMVNQIEMIRSQLNSINTLLTVGDGPSANASSYGDVRTAANSLDARLIDIEDELIQRRLTGQGQDTVRWPPKLLTKINYLASGLAGSDFPPTNQQREVHALFKQQLSTLRNRLDELLNKDIQSFNRLLQEKRIQNVITSVR